MLKKIFPKLNKRAFTLIEILLAIAVLAIVSVSIGAVIISTQNNTAQMFNEQELQQQLSEAQEIIHNEILATNAGVKYWVKNDEGSGWQMTLKDSGNEAYKMVALYNLDTKEYVLTKTYFLYNNKDRTLSKAVLTEEITKNTQESITVEVDTNPAQILTQVPTWTLVASNVELFKLDLEKYEKNRLITFNIEIEQEGSVYPADDTIYIRNEIDVNKILTIDKYHTIRIPKPTIENTIFGYDSAEHGPTELGYLERFISHGEGSTLKAVKAGVYTITYRLKDKDATMWEDGTTTDITYTWSIQKRTVGLSWGQTEWIYDGQKHSTTCVATNLAPGDTCELRLDNNSVGPNVSVETCTAWPLNENYAPPSTNFVQLKITKQTASASVVLVDQTYNGSNQSMVSCTSTTGGTMRYYISTKNTAPALVDITSTSCLAKNAGTYYVWYKIVADTSGNYQDTDVIYLGPVTMYKKAAATYGYAKDLVFNDAEQIGVWGSNIKNIEGDYKKKNAGTYSAVVTPDSNHTWANGVTTQSGTSKAGTSDPITVTWTIAKHAGSVTKPTGATGLMYNKNNQVLLTKAGTTPYGEVKYSLDKVTWSTTFPQGKDAGNYVIYYKSTGDSNHEPTSGNDYITVNIARWNCATYTKTNKVYTGSTQIGVTGDSVIVTITGAYSGDIVKEYTAYVTPTKNYAWSDGSYGSLSVKWNITPASSKVTKAPTPLEPRYTGGELALVSAGSVSVGHMEYSMDGENWSKDIPKRTNANLTGYTVYYRCSGDANHSPSAAASISAKILRQQIDLPTGKDYTYDGNEKTGITYSTTTMTKKSGNVKGTAANDYSAKFQPNTNYEWKDGTTGEKEVTWKIKKAAGQVTAPKANTLTYNTKDQTLTTKGSTSYGTMQYKLEGGSWQDSVPTGKNAGTYKVYYRSTGDSNHEPKEGGPITVTIKKSPTATLTRKDGKTSFPYSGSSITGVTATNASISGNSGKNVGGYTAKATPNANYCWEGTVDDTSEKTLDWSITIVAGSCTAPTAKTGLVYNKSAQTLINAGSTSYGKMKYKVNDGSWSESLPTATNAGTYKVYYYSTGDTNHNATSQSQYIEVTIAKASGSCGKPTATNPTYNGKNQAVATAPSSATGTVYYSWYSNTGFSTTIPVWDGAGSWTLYYYAEASANYTRSSTGSITVSIQPLKDAWASGGTYTYSGSSITGVSGGNVTWSGATTGSASTTYTAYATPAANHAWSDTGTTEQRTVTWTINGYLFKVGNEAVARGGDGSCVKGCSRNGIYESSGAARGHYSCSERFSCDQWFTVGYIYNGSYHDSLTGPITTVGAYAIHPSSSSNFYDITTNKYRTPQGWVPIENCYVR